MRYESDLSDAQWELVRPFVESRMGRPAKVDRREVLNAIFYVLRTGCQWRMLPKEFPHWSTVQLEYGSIGVRFNWSTVQLEYGSIGVRFNWSTVHSCFWRWRQNGTLEALHEALHQKSRVKAGRSAYASAAVIDSQSVKTTEKGAHVVSTGPRKSKDASATS